MALGQARPVDRERTRENTGWQSNSVRRALAILESLKESPRQLSLSEISRRLSLPKSTTSLLLSTLESMGYLTRETVNHRYSLSLKAYGLGFGLLNYLELSRRARPILNSIALTLKVTASVAVLEGDQALFIEKADGIRQPCCDIYPGRRTNLQCTAVGKILLAYVSEENENEFLSRHRSIRHTSWTIISPKELVTEIATIRRQGYALDNQEEELFVRCVAVPVSNSDGAAVAALGITGSVNEIRSDSSESLARYLKTMSERILHASADGLAIANQ